jgi:hypothetical protein
LAESLAAQGAIQDLADASPQSDEPMHLLNLMNRGLEPILSAKVEEQFPYAMAHFARLSKHPAFAPDVIPCVEKIDHALAP